MILILILIVTTLANTVENTANTMRVRRKYGHSGVNTVEMR